MLTEEIQKKLRMWGLIGLTVIGALFIIWAIFLNRGTLTIQADTPFSINIAGIRTETCAESPCSTVLAPGDYSITLQKEKYRDIEIDINVPIWGETNEKVIFEFIPIISKLGLEEELNLFTEPENGSEENYKTYLKVNPETKRQTLYYHELEIMDEEEASSDAKVATSFIRTIKDYKIIPNIEENNTIALIDNSSETSVLYLIDLEEKTRDAVLEYPIINDLAWIPRTEKFLFEAIDESEISPSIFQYEIEQAETTKLDLKAKIKNTAIISEGRVIAAVTAPGSTTAFIDYSILSNQGNRIVDFEGTLPEGIKLDSDKKSLIFLSDGTVYQLQFKE